MEQLDYNKAGELAAQFTQYAKTLANADRIRLAAYVVSLVNAVQQTANIDQDAMVETQDDMTVLFNDVEEDDPMEPGYHVHNFLENLGDDLEHLADVMDEQAAA